MKHTDYTYHYSITKTENFTLDGALVQVKDNILCGCANNMTIHDETTGELIVHIENGVIKWMTGDFAQALYFYLKQ